MSDKPVESRRRLRESKLDRMKKSEQDYPTRAEYAAALKWWEIFAIVYNRDYSRPVLGRDGLGPMGRCLVSLHERRRPSSRRNWTPHLIGFSIATVGPIVPIGIMAYGDFALAWFLLGVGVAVFMLVASQAVFVAGAVLAFRAGGWEQVLRDRERDLAWREQLKVMLGDVDGAAGRRSTGLWRRVRRAG